MLCVLSVQELHMNDMMMACAVQFQVSVVIIINKIIAILR